MNRAAPVPDVVKYVTPKCQPRRAEGITAFLAALALAFLALDLHAAEDACALDPEHRCVRAGRRRRIAGNLPSAEYGNAVVHNPHLRRDDNFDPAHDGGGLEDDLLAGQYRVPEVDLDAAENGQDLDYRFGMPGALAGGPGKDGDDAPVAS